MPKYCFELFWNSSDLKTKTQEQGGFWYLISKDSDIEKQKAQIVELLDVLDISPEEIYEHELILPSDSTEISKEENIQLETTTTNIAKLCFVEGINLISLFEQKKEEYNFGQSFYFNRQFIRILLDRLAKGEVLPELHTFSEKAESKWEIVLDKATQNEIQEISSSLCGFLYLNCEKDFINKFLNCSTDFLVRIFIKKYPLADDQDYIKSKGITKSIYDWLLSLGSTNHQLISESYSLVPLEMKVRKWKASVGDDLQDFALQLNLRQNETLNDESEITEQKKWIVHLNLKSNNNVINFNDLLRFTSKKFAQEKISPAAAEGFILKTIGEAMQIFPPLSLSLSDKINGSILISTDEAYQLIKDAAPKLANLGIIISMPSWWNDSRSKIGLKLNIQASKNQFGKGKSSTTLGLKQMLDYQWTVAIGDQELSVEEFKKIANNNSPLVQINNSWFELPADKIKTTLEFLEKNGETGEVEIGNVLNLTNSLNFGVELVGLNTSGWIERLIQNQNESQESIVTPAGFIGTLRNYQLEGSDWIRRLSEQGVGACLADDMGLGKTVQLIALISHEKYTRKSEEDYIDVGPTLLIVPMSILDNWQREFSRFAPDLNVIIHHGTNRLSGNRLADSLKDVDVIITTYSLASRDENTLTDIPWYRIVLDEAQNIKNIDTKQTQAIRKLALLHHERAETAKKVGKAYGNRIALTGTPIENRLDELWSIFDFLNPSLLGTINQFRSKFANPIENGKGMEEKNILSQIIKPFILRRLKSDPTIIQDLPEKIEMEVVSSLTPEQATLYQQTLNEATPELSNTQGIQRKGIILSLITKLKLICNHPALMLKDSSGLPERSGKLSLLEDLLEVMLAEGDKSLIFTQYATWGEMLAPHLTKKLNQEVLFLHGGLTQKARQKMIDHFQSKDGPSVFILSLRAGGFGLNLTEANQVIHYDQWWNPAVEAQATDRAHRIGQKKTVQVRKLITTGTLEEKISKLLAKKKALAQEIINPTKNLFTELSTDQLLSLLSLGKEFESTIQSVDAPLVEEFNYGEYL